MKAAAEITWKDGLGAKKSLEEAAKEAGAAAARVAGKRKERAAAMGRSGCCRLW